MKKQDWILFGIIVAVALAGYLFYTFAVQEPGQVVVVAVDGQEYGRYPLSEDQEIVVGEGNRLVIRDGSAYMIWADCPDQLCVRQKSISRTGETIVCLPNRVVATVEGEESDGGLDAVAQ